MKNISQDKAPNVGAASQGLPAESGVTVSYVVIENTPGYLPEDDDPATFGDHKSACEYMRERVEDYVDFVMEGYGWRGPMPIVSWFENGAGAYVTDAQREHDLGRYIYVDVMEDES